MWNWKPEKRILEDLFAAGEVVVAGRDGFQRLYDLPERVIPREQLEAPVPSEEEFRRGYALRAVQGARGADRGRDRRALPLPGRREGDAAGRGRARRRQDSSAGRGRRRRAAGGRAGRRGARRRAGRRRARSARSTTSSGTARSSSGVFGFDHVIEVYKPEPQRVYGYYVLPFLVRRPARRPRRPEVRPGGGRAAGASRSTSSRGVRRSGALEAALEQGARPARTRRSGSNGSPGRRLDGARHC